jgi:hypothetical protein
MLPRLFLPGVLIGSLILAGCAATQPAGIEPGADRVSPVRHTVRVDSAGPWAIHVLTVDLRDSDVVISSARPAAGIPGRETTSSMTRKERAQGMEPAGAVNADFYSGPGYTISPQVIAGEVVQTEPGKPSDSWSFRFKEQFGVTRGRRILMERMTFTGYAIFENGGKYLVAGINAAPGSSRGITLLTRYAAADTGAVDSSARSLRRSIVAARIGMRGDTTLAVVGAARWNRAAPPGRESLIIRWNPDSVSIPARHIEQGDTIRLVSGFPGHADPPEVLIGGLPRLVIDGRLNPALSMDLGGPPADFARKRHPRTGVGVTRDSTTLVLVTVDGRQASSAGMTLEEFGNLMLSLGIYQGLNLDGGGSTTMVVDGAVVNSPSDLTGERPVANCLVVLRKNMSKSSRVE